MSSSHHEVGTAATVYNLPAGTYTLTVRDNCGSLTCSQTITQPAAMTMGSCSHTNTTCGNNNGSVTAGAISNANGAASYTWVNSSSQIVGTTATISGLGAGTYTLTVRDNCGSLTCSQTIQPSSGMSMGSCSHTNTACGSNNGSVSAGTIANANGPVSYTWVNSSNQVIGTTATVSGLGAGTYTLSVSDNCSSLTCSQTIAPSASMSMGSCSHTDLSCSATHHGDGDNDGDDNGSGGNSGSVTAGAIANANGPVSYTWVNSSNHVVGTTATVTGLPAGTYTLTVHDNCSSLTCSQTISQPTAMTMGSCSHTNTSCGGHNGSVTAGTITNANGHVSYSWANASHHVVGTTATVTGLAPGTYTLTVHDNCSSLNCTQTVGISGEISCSITSSPTGGDSLTGGNPDVIYLGYGAQSTQLVSNVTGDGPFTYTWSPCSGLSNTHCASPVFTPTTGGMYTFTLTVTSGGGCSSTCDITICVLDIRVSAKTCGSNNNGSLVYLCQGSSEGGGSQTISVNVNQVAHYLSNGASLGACNQSCNSQRADLDVTTTTIETATSGFEISVYPNPFASQFHMLIMSESSERIDMRIFTLTGQLLSETNGVATNTEVSLGDQFPAGVYFVEVKQGDVKKVLRMVKAE